MKVLLGCAAMLALIACGHPQGGADTTKESHPIVPPPEAPKKDEPAPEQIVDAYLKAELEASPGMGRGLGLHEYDGKVAPITAAHFDREAERAKAAIGRIDSLDLAAIPDPVRLDLQLVRLHAARAVFEHDELQLHKKLLNYNGLFDVSSYLVRDYAPIEQRTKALLDHVEAASAQVDNLLTVLAPAQPRTHLQTAQKVLAGMREYYEGDVKKATRPAVEKDPQLAARYERVIGAGLASVDRILAWVEKTGLPNATDDYALGGDRFLKMLEVNEGLKTSLTELEKMALADYQRNYDAFVATAKKIDPKLSVQAVAQKVASERLSKDQVIPTARKQLEDLLAFIEKNDVISIVAPDRATVEVTPPFMRWNSAFLDMAGPFEKASGSFYYISPPDPSWPPEMQESYLPYAGDLLSTSTHEVYPGHFVQGLHQRRAPTLAMKMLESYAFVEGWAHYSEEMMFEAGYGKGDARLELGQLSNALLRNCRFIAALGLHTEGMTVKQADTLFREKCLIDPGNAIQQAYRGTFDPGYLSYTLGKLQILELRKAFFEKRGTKSFREFHDWLLSFGSAPVSLIRERL